MNFIKTRVLSNRLALEKNTNSTSRTPLVLIRSAMYAQSHHSLVRSIQEARAELLQRCSIHEFCAFFMSLILSARMGHTVGEVG